MKLDLMGLDETPGEKAGELDDVERLRIAWIDAGRRIRATGSEGLCSINQCHFLTFANLLTYRGREHVCLRHFETITSPNRTSEPSSYSE